MQGRLFLGAARLLQEKGQDEAAYRSAISRAYYACFIELRGIAFARCAPSLRVKAGIKDERGIRHVPLRFYLEASPSPAIRQLGEDLADLHNSRQEADYNMLVSTTRERARDVIEQAGEVLLAIDAAEPAEIGRAMEQYIRQCYR